jgi:hypothetical protein
MLLLVCQHSDLRYNAHPPRCVLIVCAHRYHADFSHRIERAELKRMERLVQAVVVQALALLTGMH